MALREFSSVKVGDELPERVIPLTRQDLVNYAGVSGDLNPIHVADLTARPFGFRAAIAHGMWSMARCAAEIDRAVPASVPRVLEVQFRKPVFLPSWLSLRSARCGSGAQFALLDAQGERLHLAGSLRPAA